MNPSLRQVLPRTLQAIEEGIARRWHPGAQLYIWHKGDLIADAGIGLAVEDRPMTPDTLLLWLSSGKPLTAVAIAMLMERGLLNLDDPVAAHLPPFAQGGKEGVTLRHLLTHTAGFPNPILDWANQTWDQIIDRICRTPLAQGWEPGRRAAYHVQSSWYILGELVRLLDGRPLSLFLRQELFLPLGMTDAWLGMDEDFLHASAPRFGRLHNTRRPDNISVNSWDSDLRARTCQPGGNAYGPIRQLGAFYRMLLEGGELEGRRILQPSTVALLTSRHRRDMHDETFGHVMDWGLGFIVDSNHHGAQTLPYSFGRHSSPAAFGHGGNQSSIAFADPQHQLVVAWVCNGTPGDKEHHQRNLAINSAIYQDLGLA